MAENDERLKVQANPAKSFFVSMLIKDITLYTTPNEKKNDKKE